MNIDDFYTYNSTGSVYKILDIKEKYVKLLYIQGNKNCGEYKLSTFQNRFYFHKSTEQEISNALAERLKS